MKISEVYKEFYEKSKIIEQDNLKRKELAAYYTNDVLLDEMYDILPNIEKNEIVILEPAVGIGNFIPLIIEKYKNKSVTLILNDIDNDIILELKNILKTINIPTNFTLKFICGDYLLKSYENIDLIIGNPPYMNNKEHKYNMVKINKKSTDLYSFFLEKSIKESKYICYIIPKTFIDSSKYYNSRVLLENKVQYIVDFGSNGFKDVRIETIGILINNKMSNDTIKIKSLKLKLTEEKHFNYISDKQFKVWLIYRNKTFDEVVKKLKLGIFTVYRDRQITNKYLQKTPKADYIRVLRSRNIADGEVLDIIGYDRWISQYDLENKTIIKYLNRKMVVAVPNMTYYPRAIFLPANTIVNGSVALLETTYKITEVDLRYFATNEFREYYKIARNHSERTLNIDNNSVYFFGIMRRENE